MALQYGPTVTPQAGQLVSVSDPTDAATPNKRVLVPAFVPVDASGNVAAGGGKQESLALVTANTPAPAQSVYGGDYIFAQQATSYGTVALQVLGPDGATYTTLVSKSASDGANSTLLTLGSNATVRATVTGTTGAYATLSRAPA